VSKLQQRPSFSGSSSIASMEVVRPLNVPHARVLMTERPTRWRAIVVDRLDQLCRLPVGWNGYHAGPVDFGTASFALNMLKSICDPEAPAPSVVPGVNGDLQIEWHLAKGDIELHVRAPNDVHAWRKTPDTNEDGDELVLTVDFTEVVRWIKDVTEPARAVVSAAA